MAGLRRLLEEDLKLDKHTLDPFKKLISQELDEVSFSRGIIYLVEALHTFYISYNLYLLYIRC